jgi:hypothetical protein
VVLEYWSVGVLILVESDLFFNGTRRNIKTDHHPFLIFNTPLFSPIRRLYEPEAITPWVFWLKDHPSGVRPKPGPPGQDYLLSHEFFAEVSRWKLVPKTIADSAADESTRLCWL